MLNLYYDVTTIVGPQSKSVTSCQRREDLSVSHVNSKDLSLEGVPQQLVFSDFSVKGGFRRGKLCETVKCSLSLMDPLLFS